MCPRITLEPGFTESENPAPRVAEAAANFTPSRQIAQVDWHGPVSDALMLYLAEEPRIGDDFSYNGVDWRIVDYRDGWIAELVVHNR